MSAFDFREPDHFTTGALGPPGKRIFYLQVGEGPQVATFRIEKQQVLALARGLEQLMADLATTDLILAEDADLQEPLLSEWVVGTIGLGYDESADRLLVAVKEFSPDENDLEDLVDSLLEPDGPATARVLITRAQAGAFIERARATAEAGRPTCLFCGRPKDPEGHICPRMN